MHPLIKQGTQKKNPDTQFSEKWVGIAKNTQLLHTLSKALLP